MSSFQHYRVSVLVSGSLHRRPELNRGLKYAMPLSPSLCLCPCLTHTFIHQANLYIFSLSSSVSLRRDTATVKCKKHLSKQHVHFDSVSIYIYLCVHPIQMHTFITQAFKRAPFTHLQRWDRTRTGSETAIFIFMILGRNHF